MTTFSDAPQIACLPLEEFRRLAGQGNSVAVVKRDSQMRVIALGMTPDGRSVAWLEPGIDTAQHFIDALSDAFGQSVAEQTARELQLLPQPGEALASQTIKTAIDMAETAKTAMDGVNFLATLNREIKRPGG